MCYAFLSTFTHINARLLGIDYNGINSIRVTYIPSPPSTAGVSVVNGHVAAAAIIAYAK